MPKKQNAFQPRVYPKRDNKGLVYYILHWVQGNRKFHRCHDGVCECGTPRPNRPCPHLKAAQECLLHFEHKVGKRNDFDCPLELLFEEFFQNSAHARSDSTLTTYRGVVRIFLGWASSEKVQITHVSQIETTQANGNRMAEFKSWMLSTPYVRESHSKESRKILRQIDYIVRRDKIARDSAEYRASVELQALNAKMKAAMNRREEKYSATYVSIALRTLRTVFFYAMEKGYLKSNPLSGGRHASQKLIQNAPNQKERNPLTAEERDLLLEKLTGTSRDMLILFLYTGMRLGELVNLRWDTHVKRDWLTITETEDGWKPKWGSKRTIPYHPLVREVLERRRADHPESTFVFETRSNRGGQMVKFRERNVQDRFEAIFKKYGIKGEEQNGVTIHCFRHTFATMLLSRGEELVNVRDMMGHKDIKTTMIYYHRLKKQVSTVLATIR